MTDMTPGDIVAELDRHILGQADAKRAVAVAVRNRWRRARVDESIRAEIVPKNILMIGPTGVGKTEIARRLAALVSAPFVKVEATRFTEVGYVGREVETIVRDLADAAVVMCRDKAVEQVAGVARRRAESRLVKAMLSQPDDFPAAGDDGAGRGERLLVMLRDGALDERRVEIEVSAPAAQMEIMGPPGMEEVVGQLRGMMSSLSSNAPARRKLSVRAALRRLQQEEADKLIDEDAIKVEALDRMQESGIVFIDEIDKVVGSAGRVGADVSREGVQRDLLPLIEGCTVPTRHGMVKTDHILFVAAGAFHLSQPSDLIPELQGRLPIRVELEALGADEFQRILTEPYASLIRQYQALLAVEGTALRFDAAAVRRIAEIAHQVNEQTENIGARRLHTVMERLLEDALYSLPQGELRVDADYVEQRLSGIAEDPALRRFVL